VLINRRLFVLKFVYLKSKLFELFENVAEVGVFLGHCKKSSSNQRWLPVLQLGLPLYASEKQMITATARSMYVAIVSNKSPPAAEFHVDVHCVKFRNKNKS